MSSSEIKHSYFEYFVFRIFSRSDMGFIQNKNGIKRESHTNVSLNYQRHSGLQKIIKIMLQLQENLIWAENALKSRLNKKKI